MKKAIIIMIIAVIIIIIILSSLVAYAKGDSNDNKMEDKVTQELMYLNQYFVTMLEILMVLLLEIIDFKKQSLKYKLI